MTIINFPTLTLEYVSGDPSYGEESYYLIRHPGGGDCNYTVLPRNFTLTPEEEGMFKALPTVELAREYLRHKVLYVLSKDIADASKALSDFVETPYI